MTIDTVEQAHLYRYKVSLETTKDRVNVSITVYSDAAAVAEAEAIALLESTRESLQNKGYEVSPILQKGVGLDT
jgi:hypothetical protein